MQVQLLVGDTLQLALARSKRSIALFNETGDRTGELMPDQAAILLATGTRKYEAVGSKRRVRYIRAVERALPFRRAEIDSRTPNAHSDSFWAGRGCVRFWADQRTQVSV